MWKQRTVIFYLTYLQFCLTGGTCQLQTAFRKGPAQNNMYIKHNMKIQITTITLVLSGNSWPVASHSNEKSKKKKRNSYIHETC